MSKPLIITNLDEVMTWLERIENHNEFRVEGRWDAFQNLSHCALALEFSLYGYPLLRSKLFQNTIGKVAFQYFSWRGFMRHDTSKPTRGAEPLPPNGAQAGVQQLRNAIIAFDQWNGNLQPHEAFGLLTKKQYAKFHTMHISNHLELFHL